MPTIVKTLLVGGGLLLVALVIDIALPQVMPDSSIRQLLMLAAVNVIIALSLNVINGMAGQFSIGHAGFVGVGAYGAAVVASNVHKMWPGEISLGRSFVVVPIAVLTGSLLAAFFGFLVGLPSLRLKGDYLAIVTLGFAEMFRLLIATAPAGSNQTGLAGLLGKLGGVNGYMGTEDQGIPLYAGPFWILGALMFAVLISWRLKFSGWGRALRALREDEVAAAAVGIDPTRFKVISFVIAAAGAGMAGSLMSTMRDGSGAAQPDTFTFQLSFDAITMVILGGSGSISGSMLGALFVTFTVKAIELLQALDSVQAFRQSTGVDLNALRMVVYAAVLILVMIMRPEGVFGEREVFGLERRKAPAA